MKNWNNLKIFQKIVLNILKIDHAFEKFIDFEKNHRFAKNHQYRKRVQEFQKVRGFEKHSRMLRNALRVKDI